MTILSTQISALEEIDIKRKTLIREYYKKKLLELGVREENTEDQLQQLMLNPLLSQSIEGVPDHHREVFLKKAQFIFTNLSNDGGIANITYQYLIEKNGGYKNLLTKEVKSFQSGAESKTSSHLQDNEYQHLLKSLLDLDSKECATFSDMRLAIASYPIETPQKLSSQILNIINSIKSSHGSINLVRTFVEELDDHFSDKESSISIIMKVLQINDAKTFKKEIAEHNQRVSEVVCNQQGFANPKYLDLNNRLIEFLLNKNIKKYQQKHNIILAPYSSGYDRAYRYNIQNVISRIEKLEEVSHNDRLSKDIQSILTFINPNNCENLVINNLYDRVINLIITIQEDPALSKNEYLNKAIDELAGIVENVMLFEELKNSRNSTHIGDVSIDDQHQDNQDEAQQKRLDGLTKRCDEISRSSQKGDEELLKFIFKEYLNQNDEQKLFKDLDELKEVQVYALRNKIQKIQDYILEKTLLSYLEIGEKVDYKELDVLFLAKEIMQQKDNQEGLVKLSEQDEELFKAGLKFIESVDKGAYKTIQDYIPQKLDVRVTAYLPLQERMTQCAIQ